MFVGCPPASCCLFGCDDYARADADDPGADWEELGSADYDIDSGELLVAAAGELEYQVSGSGNLRARVRCLRDASQRIKLEIGRDAATGNHLFVELFTSGGCDLLRIGQVVSSAEEDLLDPVGQAVEPIPVGPVSDNQRHQLQVCWFPGAYPGLGLLRARLDLADGRRFVIQGETDEEAFGLLAALDAEAGVRFSSWRFGRATDEGFEQCPDCTLPQCAIGSDDLTDEDPCKWLDETFLLYHPDWSYDQKVTAEIVLDVGESASVRINSLKGGSQYHWATLSLSGTTLTLTIGKDGDTLESVERELDDGEAAPLSVTMCVEYFLGNLLACAAGLRVEDVSDPVVGGWYSGKSGSADWQSWTYAKVGDDCPHCNCGTGHCPDDLACISGSRPNYFLVDIPVGRFTPMPGCAPGYSCETAFLGLIIEYQGSTACVTATCGYVRQAIVTCGVLTVAFDVALTISFDAGTGETVLKIDVYRNVNILGGCTLVLFASFEWRAPGPVDCTVLDVLAPLTYALSPDDAGSICTWTTSGPARAIAI